MLIINDVHLGVQRTGGTTLGSQMALRQYLRDGLTNLLKSETDEVTVNGDLFDAFTVDVIEVVKAYEIFADWLFINQNAYLNLIQGNHDSNPRGDKLSSFHLFCHFIRARFPARVKVLDKGYAYIGDKVCCIPHMPNQDLFNIEIDKAIQANIASGSTLLLHCNYKNGFAENSDHSLNLSDDQVGRLMIAGWNLVLGHEHQGYELRGGRVKVVGNQFPSSVADCLGNTEKHALQIDADGTMRYVKTWEREEHFEEVNWRELDGTPRVLRNFFRIVGEATAAESADVVSTIAKFRQACCDNVYVVTNAVKVEGCAIAEELAEVSFDSIQAFDILGAIYERLDEKETAVVKELINAE